MVKPQDALKRKGFLKVTGKHKLVEVKHTFFKNNAANLKTIINGHNMTIKRSANHIKFKHSILYNFLVRYKMYTTMKFDSHNQNELHG
jgi:hypothetical protein